MKENYIYSILLLVLISCHDEKTADKKNSAETTIVKAKSIKERMTADTVSISSYISSYYGIIIKIDGTILDTADLFNPPIFLGDDTMIYSKIARDPDNFDYRTSTKSIFGYPSNLMLYANGSSKPWELPNFSPYFSSMSVIDRKIYYNGQPEKSGPFYMYRWGLQTQQLDSILLFQPLGTDIRCPITAATERGDSLWVETSGLCDGHQFMLSKDLQYCRLVKRYNACHNSD